MGNGRLFQEPEGQALPEVLQSSVRGVAAS